MGRLEVRITADDVGKRVSVRRVTESGDDGARFTDTVGVLTSWDDGVLTVVRRSGDRVRIAASSLVAGKIVPPVPARRRGPRASYGELARITGRAWQPVEREQLGDWELRATAHARPGAARGAGPRPAGGTWRADSVLPLGDPGLPLDAALARVRAWYARRGLPPAIQVATGAEGTQELLGERLTAAGWVREVSAEVRTAPLAPLGEPGDLPGASGDPAVLEATVRRVRLTREAGGTGSATVAPPDSAEPLGAAATAGPSVWCASVPREDPGDDADRAGARGAAPVAVGRCVVDGRWAGFLSVEVDPGHRRRGLATAVLTALARQALAEGASAAWLQLGTDDTAARALYDRWGFELHHHYHVHRG